MTNREYLIKLLEESRVKAYSKGIGYTNEHLIDEAIKIARNHDLLEEFDAQAASKHDHQHIKEIFESGIIHEEPERSTIPLITSLEEPVIQEETVEHQSPHPHQAPVAKKKSKKLSQ